MVARGLLSRPTARSASAGLIAFVAGSIILIDSDFPGFSIPYTLIAGAPRRAARSDPGGRHGGGAAGACRSSPGASR